MKQWCMIAAFMTLAAVLTLSTSRAQEAPKPPVIQPNKPAEQKPDDAKQPEAKAPEAKAQEAKAPEPKTPDAKGDEKKEKTVDEKIGDAAKSADGAKAQADTALINADSAWMLVSTAFVMLMVPGLALFYAGMVRRKNVLATMMQSMICLSIVGVFWIGIGYSLAFGDPWLKIGDKGFLGWSSHLVFMRGVSPSTMMPNLNIPVYLHMAYQGMFAIITPALISGALAERIRFKPYLLFVLLWMVCVYCPLAQCVWAMNWNWDYKLMSEPNQAMVAEAAERAKIDADGAPDDAKKKKAYEEADAKLKEAEKKVESRRETYLKVKFDAIVPEGKTDAEKKKDREDKEAQIKAFYEGDSGKKMTGYLGGMDALDFAGGTVVHIAAGLSSLAAFLALRKRFGYPEHAFHPNSMVLCLTGAGILWFGWFGFNGGSGLGSGNLAVSAFAATQAAAAGAALSWSLVEWLHRGKPTALGFASGVVAGLVAVTPAAGYIVPWAGLVIGLLAGVICYFSVFMKSIFKYDDSLDAFGVHGVGGFLGAVLTGVFCWWPVNKVAIVNDGMFYNADEPMKQVGIQLYAALFSVVLAFVASFILVKVIDLVMGFTVTEDEETTGLDRTEHGEAGFDLGLALESVGSPITMEPKSAIKPPNGVKHYAVVVDGASAEDLSKAWSDLCMPGAAAASADFKAVYPNLTTFQGSRFRFRGGDANAVKESLKRLLESRLKKPISTKVE